MYEMFCHIRKKDHKRVEVEDRTQVHNPKAWMPNFRGKHTWTNREIEWYNAEKELIFACTTEEQCGQWVALLHWLINK